MLGDLIKAGKIRHIGVSNETPWGVMAHLRLTEKSGAPRIQSIQNPYSLINRVFEPGLSEVALRENVPLLAYSPLAMGVLSGKYLDAAAPAAARITLFRERYKRFLRARSVAATTSYVALARAHGLSPAQMAIAFVLSRPFVASAIIGCTSVAQLEHDAASIKVKLFPELVAAIDAIHAENPSPVA